MESDYNNGGECGICCGVSFKSDWDIIAKPSLTHFMPLVSFDTPWKHQKPVAWNGLTPFPTLLSNSVMAFI